MEFRILGPLEVRDQGRPLPLTAAKQRALLAILLVHAGEVVSKDRLIDELWGAQPPASAANALQVYVTQLRRILEPERKPRAPSAVLPASAGGYLIRVGAGELDAQRFERQSTAAVAAREAGDPGGAAEGLRRALEIWRGPALADFTYEPFAQAEIARLEELRLIAVEERIEADLALGRHAALVGELEALVETHPLRERLRGQLMLALYRSGRQAEAVEAYRMAHSMLMDELGIAPSPALQELERAILRQSSALEAPSRVPPAGVGTGPSAGGRTAAAGRGKPQDGDDPGPRAGGRGRREPGGAPAARAARAGGDDRRDRALRRQGRERSRLDADGLVRRSAGARGRCGAGGARSVRAELASGRGALRHRHRRDPGRRESTATTSR